MCQFEGSIGVKYVMVQPLPVQQQAGYGVINGDYCSLNNQKQCDPNAGASGTWSVAPAEH